MDEGIGIQLTNQTQLVIQNFEQLSLGDIPQTEESAQASGNENGAVLSKREWLNRQAEDRKQELITVFFGGTGGIQDGHAINDVTTEPIEDYAINTDITENTLITKNTLKTDITENTVITDEPENLTELSFDDLISLAIEHEDFADFRNQPKKFWQQVRQMSETRCVEADSDETRATSSYNEFKYNEFLTDMQAKGLSPREYAKTLPPNERTVFLARFQLEEIFGASIFNDDGVTLSENGQIRVREILNKTDASGEKMSDEKSATPFIPGVAVPQSSNGIASGNTTLQNASFDMTSHLRDTPFDTAPQTVPGASPTMLESYSTRISTNTNSESATAVGAVSRRDSGAAIGGALINGAFISVDNYQNLEHNEIGGSRAVGNVFGETGNGFAAGATGAMFGAAIGGVIPGAGTDVGGVLGFVSGVVVGVEADQGLRWLGADKTVSDAANQTQLISDNSFAPGLTLQPALA